MNFLRQGTSTITTLGPFLSNYAGDTEMTSLSIAQADIRLSYNGDSWHQVHHNQDGVNLISYGSGAWYKLKLDTTDTALTNTTIPGANLVIAVHKAGSLAVWKEYAILPQNTFDYLFTASPTVAPILDDTVEGSYTMRQYMTLMAAVLFSKAAGGGTTSITFRDIQDTKNRVTATVDSNGNRTSLTLIGT
jgi:hypothetical protein